MHTNCLLLLYIPLVYCYSNKLYTLITFTDNLNEAQCGMPRVKMDEPNKEQLSMIDYLKERTTPEPEDYSFQTISFTTPEESDPIYALEKIMHQSLFGTKRDPDFETKLKKKTQLSKIVAGDVDIYAQLPMGNVMRAETFQNITGVHLPMLEYMHRGHCYLNITNDHMQTALNAFAILLAGTIDDVLRLPRTYVLRSARTIAMMKIEREKLAATWQVVKGQQEAAEVPYGVLEKYRPLFKYINGREMARLNLSDERIVSFIGTHPDLNRHQVGVVAGQYIKLNRNWTEPRYLNIMNNLLCGVPMTFMRRLPENTYLQLSHQLFYHISACDPLQRRFYLAMMTRTQALGKPYSWSARDVSRLGLLLTDVDGSDLAAINPESMAGITAQIMLRMSAHKLTYITDRQLRYLEPKPLNILARKLDAYQNQRRQYQKSGWVGASPNTLSMYLFKVILVLII